MKNFNFKIMSADMMKYLGIGGLGLAFSLGIASIAVAANNPSKTVSNIPIRSALLYGKIRNSSFLNDLENRFGRNGTTKYDYEISANSQTVIVPLLLYNVIDQIKTPFEKISVNIVGDGLLKNVSKYTNTLKFELISTNTYIGGSGSFKLNFQVFEKWNEKGLRTYEFTPSSVMTAGVSTAGQDLFGGLIKKGADLTKWRFSKIDSASARTDGTDADFAWQFNSETGKVIMLNKAVIKKDTLQLKIIEANRSTEF